MERKITMKKGTIEKKIPVNLVSEYMQLGWKEVKNQKEEKEKVAVEKINSFRLK
jgi:hypothetical protein